MSVGCGSSSKTAHVEGKVTIKGAAIPADAEAFIVFTPAKAGSKGTPVPIKDGVYDSPETPIGNVKVYFQISQATGPVKKSERTGEDYRDTKNLVPASATNGFDLEVTGDKTDQDFKL